MKQILDEVYAELLNMAWARVPGATNYNDARFLRGESKTWTALVVDFDVSDQGFPPGTRGYDGTATSKTTPTIVHLPREVAQATFEKAIKELEELEPILLAKYHKLKKEVDEGNN